MTDQLSSNKTNGKAKNSRSSNGSESDHLDDHNPQDGPIERKRQRLSITEVENEDVEMKETELSSPFSHCSLHSDRSDASPNSSFEKSNPRFVTDLVLGARDYNKILGKPSSILTQTFWNTSYKDDIENSNFECASSFVSQHYPSTSRQDQPSTSRGFSASQMLEPEMEMIPLSLTESTVQCPLCHAYFPIYEVEFHASTCLEKQQQ